ncbi:hypothetical protein PIB30_035398 [Stylosanthes scabra]|uniref:RNase H type-1 domain-containing protein n=1 Tax=Stylosanthes scabra TaxID=79078 RepID=A0ABU6ZCG1_9FABA|nr:hypothetical protein [Stylosanthes scabra]
MSHSQPIFHGPISITQHCLAQITLRHLSREVAHSPLAAEANAMREALITATKLIKALKSGADIWEIGPILQDIRKVVQHIHGCGFTWSPKEGNQLAHEVAKLVAHGNLDPHWVTNPTHTIRRLINYDRRTNQIRWSQTMIRDVLPRRGGNLAAATSQGRSADINIIVVNSD